MITNKYFNLKKILFCIILLCLLKHLKKKLFFYITIDNIVSKKYKNKFNNENLSLNFINHQYYYSDKFNTAKIAFQIEVFDKNHKYIIPSDLTLYYNLHLLCFIIINDTVNIYSLPSIKKDKYFECTEFYNSKENIKIGVIIYRTNNDDIIEDNYTTYVIDNNIFNNKYPNDDIFDSSKINYNYSFFLSKLQKKQSSLEMKKLKKLYISKPICTLKRGLAKRENQWYYINIFNQYFCLCKGSNCLKTMNNFGRCKYFFYIYLIDINNNVYKKEDFLLMDFILKKLSSDDVYPIFEEMIKRNINSHYFTEKKEIYNKYCHNRTYCDSVILVKGKNHKINHNFLENHLTLILRLRQVISNVGININYINNLFYNIDYITYICIGHGVSHLKYYLYKSYYGPQNFDKLLIPNSEILISVPLKYGWKEENLIKLGLPRWEKYNYINKSLYEYKNIKSDSIFIMFTWRGLKRGGKISSFYIHNILDLINHEQLFNNLFKHNLTLYFTLHHKVLKYKSKFKMKSNIRYIEENDIAECLSKTNLVVTDFSSIIFDMIYRRKPYIIFIPDINDPEIRINYRYNSYRIINNFKNNDFKFENVYFDINSTIDKINYYIDNEFHLEKKTIQFYDAFNFKKGPHINDFINHILKL